MFFQLFILEFCNIVTRVRPNRSEISLRAAKGHSNRGNSGWKITFFTSILLLKKELNEGILDNGQELLADNCFPE